MHTTPPPGLVIPATRDPLFFRADFDAVTLQGSYSPTTTDAIKANGGATITTGPWTGLFIPYLVGANTTPPTMIMTPMLPLYWALGFTKVVDATLTEHAWRNYDRIIWDPHPWNLEENGMTFSLDQAKQFGTIVKSWGFWNCLWQGAPNAADPMWPVMVGAHLCDFGIPGEEIDSKMDAEQLPPMLDSLLAGPLNGIPMGVHYTAGPRGGYPIDAERDTFLAGGATGDWSTYNGRVHLMLQSNQDHSAGRQAACTVYARQRMAGAPDSRIVFFETMATDELEDPDLIWTEEVGCLRSLELLYAFAPQNGGSGNGLRYPDGGGV